MRTARCAAIALVVAYLIVLVRPATAATTPPVLSDGQKQDTELQILSKFVPFAESFWGFGDPAAPAMGHYNAVGSGVTQPRGAGDIAYAYATLLTVHPDQAAFGGVSRDVMLAHTVDSIRYEAYTSVLAKAGYSGTASWGGGTWQASLEAYNWAFAAHLLWNHLDADTRGLVEKVVTGEANILLTKPIASGTPGNTAAEDAAWNAPTPALAAVMFPSDPNAAAWRQMAIKLALNASSTTADANGTSVVDGHPLSYWMASVNLNDDLTIVNHGFFNPTYQQVVPLTVNDAAVFYGQAGQPIPQAFGFRVQEIWNKILGRLMDDNGDMIAPAGQDWISKDYQHLDYLSVMATRYRDPAASVLESRALRTVAARQATHQDGSLLGQSVLGYESMLAQRLTASWWTHHLFGPSPVPTQGQFEAARATTSATTRFPDVDVITARVPEASASMSWDSKDPAPRVMGLWIPREERHLDDPLLTYYAPGSLVGSASGKVSAYSCDCHPDHFSTAGVVGDRDFSMTVFPDGMAMLLDRGTGSTFTYALERIPGLTGDRTIYSASGTGLGSLSGRWANVADRAGMIVLGGAGIGAADVSGTNDTRVITGSTGTGSGNRGAALYPDQDHAATARLADLARQPDVPDGWSALTVRAPDGTDRLAAGRWSGPETITTGLTDDRGAPVPEGPAVIDGDTANATLSMPAPSSYGQTLRFFVHSDGALDSRQQSPQAATLTNPGTSPVHAQVTYVGQDGATRKANRVIAPGETVVARFAGGGLTLAGPEYESLLAGRATVAGLASTIDGWRLTPAQAAPLRAVTGQVTNQLDTAISQDAAQDPDTTTVSAATSTALGDLSRLTAPSGVPSVVSAAVSQARQSASTQLTDALSHLRVTIALVPQGTARPGEPLTVRAIMFNRGQAAARAGSLRVNAPAGWDFPAGVPAFPALEPRASVGVDLKGTVAANASVGTDAPLGVGLSYQTGDRTISADADTTVRVQPLFAMTTSTPTVPLAAGGWNRLTVALHNDADAPLPVKLAADTPDGVTTALSTTSVTVPAGGDAHVDADVRNEGQSSGTGRLTITATSAGGVAVSTPVTLRYGDDLAANPVGAPYPHAFADSNQAAFPPDLANDADPSTFWVSGGPATAGSGPTPQHPVALGVDLGVPLGIGSVTVAPRPNYGPKSYVVQVSDDGQQWTTVATVTSAPNTAGHTTFPPTTARYVRLSITGSWDATNRNVQVTDLEVRGA